LLDTEDKHTVNSQKTFIDSIALTDMKRRSLLSVLPLAIGFAGCTDSNSNSDNYTQREGSSLVRLSVEDGFPNKIVLEADCRDERFSVEPGEELTINRESDGEECSIRVLTNDEELYSAHISDYRNDRLTVREDGEIEESSDAV